MACEKVYELNPLPLFGAEVAGIDLKVNVNEDVIERIKKDVTQHRLLIFRDQGIISGERDTWKLVNGLAHWNPRFINIRNLHIPMCSEFLIVKNAVALVWVELDGISTGVFSHLRLDIPYITLCRCPLTEIQVCLCVCVVHLQTSQPGNRPGREKPTPRSMHIHFYTKFVEECMIT